MANIVKNKEVTIPVDHYDADGHDETIECTIELRVYDNKEFDFDLLTIGVCEAKYFKPVERSVFSDKINRILENDWRGRYV